VQHTIKLQTTVRSVRMCVHCTVHNCCTQYCTELTITIALMMSTVGQRDNKEGNIVSVVLPAHTVNIFALNIALKNF